MNTHVVIGAAKAGIGEAITKRLISDGNIVIGTYESDQEDLKLLAPTYTFICSITQILEI
jgi:NAD(P)-dependent dehydrogenase (short-subunit alcohol dehydrogenase family)